MTRKWSEIAAAKGAPPRTPEWLRRSRATQRGAYLHAVKELAR